MRLLIVAAAAAALLISPAFASSSTGTGKGSPPAAATAAASSNMPMSNMPMPTMPMAGMMMIHHKVADYDKWRPAYDAHKPMRDAAGLSDCHVHQAMDNPNDVFIGCTMADMAKAKEFAASKDLKDTMKKAGVKGKPEIHYMTGPK